ELSLERKRELARAVHVEVSQPLLRFLNAWYVTHRNPPEREICSSEFLEPQLPLPEHFRMTGSVDVVSECLDRLPDRHIEKNPLVFKGAKVHSVSFSCLQAPDKAGTSIGECIEFVQPSHEPLHNLIVERRPDLTNV